MSGWRDVLVRRTVPPLRKACAWMTAWSASRRELVIPPGEERARPIREGKFQIKRMLAYLGKPVLYLERVRMGNLLLDPVLERGTYRLLTKEEWQALAKRTEERRKNSKLQQKGK